MIPTIPLRRLKPSLRILHTASSLVNSSSYACLLKDCVKNRSLLNGKLIHAQIITNSGFESLDTYTQNNLLTMYAKCKSVADARSVFEQMHNRDVVTWTAMIGAYAREGNAREALKLFTRMREKSLIKPSHFTFASILPAVSSLGAIEEGKKIHEEEVGVKPDAVTFSIVVPACTDLEILQEMHGEISRRGFKSNVFVGNALVDMYAKYGSVEAACKVFDEMSERDVISWNVMIRGYVQNGFLNEALELFDRMPVRDVVSCNAMIAGYAEHGLFDEAQKLFHEMPRRDVVSWNTMIAASVKHRHDEAALALFKEMLLTNNRPNQFTFASILPACANSAALEHGKKVHEEIDRAGFQFDVFVGSALVDMYAKCKSVEDARNVFDKMPDKNVVTWTAMIAGYAQNGYDEDAMDLFQEMQLAGLKPDPKAFAVVIPACANLAALKQGKEIHEAVVRSGLQSNVFVSSALVDMYAKCGNIEDARSIFDKMLHRGVVLWNVMIVGYAMHGFDTEALKLFDQMQQSGINPDHVTFVGVLSACCHAGLVDKGWHYFNRMRDHYQITATMRHYGCMVDLLGRSGNLAEAKVFINKMPIIPDATVWKCFLGACRTHIDVGLGELAAEHLFELDPENPASYVLLSNIYAQAGRWDGIEKVRKMMKDRGGIKETWMQLD